MDGQGPRDERRERRNFRIALIAGVAVVLLAIAVALWVRTWEPPAEPPAANRPAQPKQGR